MVRVALINPPIRTKQPPMHPPYGIALLAAIADQEGYEVVVLDVNAFRLHHEVVRSELRSEKPIDIIGIGGFIPSYRWIKFILPFLRRDFPDSLFVVGGGAMTALQEDMMKWCPEIDVGVIGEGEKTFLELLRHVEKGVPDLRQIKGILYREDGEIVRTPPRPLMTEEELDELPYPKFDLLPLEEVYWKYSSIAFSPEALQSKRRLPILSSRGCPMACKFCSDTLAGCSRTNYDPSKGAKVRFHSAKYVVEMMKWMRMRYAVDFINFLDECFTANRKRVYELCDLIIEEGLNEVIKWGCTAHPIHVDPELLSVLKEAGCTYLDLGFESGDDRVLREMRKGSTVERNRRVLKWCIRAGINPITNFIWGFPSDDLQSIYNTVKFWRDNGIICQPFWLAPYPKTQYFEEHRERILEQYDGDLEKFVMALEADTDTMVVNLTKFDDPTIIGLRELAIRHDLKRIKRYAEKMGVKLD